MKKKKKNNPGKIPTNSRIRGLFKILPELFARLTIRVNIQGDPIGIQHGKPAISPGMILKGHHNSQPSLCKLFVLLIHISHTEIVYKPVTTAKPVLRFPGKLLWKNSH